MHLFDSMALWGWAYLVRGSQLGACWHASALAFPALSVA